jgi:ParB family chromosome partitioning protein
MSTVKPKTALARLLDNVSGMNIDGAISGGDVGIAQMEEETVLPTVPSKETQSILAPESNAIKIQYVDTALCQPWAFADRPEDEMGDIDALANSIKEYGQQEPILLSPINSKTNIKYEVIFGNRRWRACKRVGLSVLAIIKLTSDQEAAVYQKEENENRKDISDLARAKSLKAQLEAGIFKNELELSKALGLSRQTLNDIMAFIRIPDALINAIPNFKNLSRKTAVRLSTLAKDPQTIEGLIQLGTKIGAKEITAINLDASLYKVLNPSLHTPKHSEDIFDVTDSAGKKMFYIKNSFSSDTTIKIAKRLNGTYDVNALKEVIYQYLANSKK